MLSDFDLAVRPGEVVGITGGNGTGKTTLVKIIAGLEFPDSGRVEFDGQDITSWSHLDRSDFVRLVTQNPLDNLFSHLTVLENLLLADQNSRGGLLKRALPKHRFETYKAHLRLLFPTLEEKMHDPVSLLSGGEIQLCALAVALVAEPKILLLDEFVSALSEENKERAVRALFRSKGSEITKTRITFVVAHNREFIEKLSATPVSLDPQKDEDQS